MWSQGAKTFRQLFCASRWLLQVPPDRTYWCKGLTLNTVFLRYCEVWVMNDKDFWFFSFFGIITIFHSIEANRWLKPQCLSPGGGLPEGLHEVFPEGFPKGFPKGLPEGLADEAFTQIFLLMVFAMVRNFWLFQHKLIINRTSSSNITILYLRRLWLQITSVSVLDKYLD